MKFYNRYLQSKALFLLACLIFSSCEKFLDIKPDKALAVPSTAKDLQALLDFEIRMNTNYPAAGDIASDDYYLTQPDWSKIYFLDDRNTYIWDKNATANQDWQYAYTRVFNANVVLDLAEKILDNGAAQEEYKAIKGAAFFFRGNSFFQIAETFTMPYKKTTASSVPGIPLRLKSDINDQTFRSSLEATYSQIIQDLKQASQLLPVLTAYKTRPNRAAAFASLARVHLVMGEYEKAGAYADSCLKLYNSLLDYNMINTKAANPFLLFNAEVIFHSINKYNSGVFVPAVAKVDTLLYSSYQPDDLRKVLFFTVNADKSIQFKGNYGGSNSGALFSGIVTDEIYLIRAECYARLGLTSLAMDMLNKLLITRWKSGTFIPFTAAASGEALKIVLRERRKELVLRGGLRWSDLRRFNNDPSLTDTLVRKLGTKEYNLPANDNRYAFLIPLSVVEQSGIAQNAR